MSDHYGDLLFDMEINNDWNLDNWKMSCKTLNVIDPVDIALGSWKWIFIYITQYLCKHIYIYIFHI